MDSCILGTSVLRVQIFIAPLDNKSLKGIMFGACFYPSQHLAESHVQGTCSVNHKHLPMTGRASGLSVVSLPDSKPSPEANALWTAEAEECALEVKVQKRNTSISNLISHQKTTCLKFEKSCTKQWEGSCFLGVESKDMKYRFFF